MVDQLYNETHTLKEQLSKLRREKYKVKKQLSEAVELLENIINSPYGEIPITKIDEFLAQHTKPKDNKEEKK